MTEQQNIQLKTNEHAQNINLQDRIPAQTLNPQNLVSKNRKINLLGLSQQSLEDFLFQQDEKPWRAAQILKWIHFQGITDFNQMSNLSKILRANLASIATISPPKIISEKKAHDETCKWLLRLNCGNLIETVFIPEKSRGTLCISSQVGCTLNCDFCSTGKQGFNRNLNSAEIIGQLWIAVRQLSKQNHQHDRTITNVVLMGMGEPLLNFDNVVNAINIMLDDNAYGLSKRRVTLSTAGVIPAMEKLRDTCNVALAVSLHAPNNTLRNALVPLNKKYPLEQLIQICKSYFANEKRRYVTIEYVMLAGINDQPEHANQLIELLKDLRVKVNLIPFNTFPGTSYKCSSTETINNFRLKLMSANINTITRKTRGDKIDAACGQLVGQVIDRTKRSARFKKKLASITNNTFEDHF